MQIVINIDEDTYKDIKRGKIYTSVRDVPQESVVAIANGTPIPKHHGLIDRLELSDHIKNRLIQTAMKNMETILPYSEACIDIVDNRIDTWIDEVKTIIEADTESEEIK